MRRNYKYIMAAISHETDMPWGSSRCQFLRAERRCGVSRIYLDALGGELNLLKLGLPAVDSGCIPGRAAAVFLLGEPRGSGNSAEKSRQYSSKSDGQASAIGAKWPIRDS